MNSNKVINTLTGFAFFRKIFIAYLLFPTIKKALVRRSVSSCALFDIAGNTVSS